MPAIEMIVQMLGAGGLGAGLLRLWDNRAKRLHEREEEDKKEFKALWREAQDDLNSLRNQLVEVRIELGQALTDVDNLREQVESLMGKLSESNRNREDLFLENQELRAEIRELQKTLQNAAILQEESTQLIIDLQEKLRIAHESLEKAQSAEMDE